MNRDDTTIDRRAGSVRPTLPTVLVALALAAVAVLATAGPGSAQSPGSGGDYGDTGVDAGVVVVRAGTRWLPVGSEGRGTRSSSCTTSSIEVVVQDDFVQPVNRQWTVIGDGGDIPFTAGPGDLPSNLPTHMRHFSPTGRWYAVMCDGVIRIVPEGGPPVTVAALLQDALDQIDPPDPGLVVTPDELHYTQLQSWLAIEPSYWVSDDATADAGRVWVTAFADPYEAIWDTGDGETEICDGPGTVWRPGMVDGSATCGHVYRQSSAGAPGDSFRLSATVHFEVTALTNAPVSFGAFPDLERTTEQVIQVGEIQAVND